MHLSLKHKYFNFQPCAFRPKVSAASQLVAALFYEVVGALEIRPQVIGKEKNGSSVGRVSFQIQGALYYVTIDE